MSRLDHNLDVGPEIHTSCQEYSLNNFNKTFVANSDNFVIFNQNIRSFESNFGEFDALLKELKSTVAVIVLTETWFSACNTECIPNYTGYHTYRSSKGGGGVSVYVHNNYNSCSIPNLRFCDDSIEVCGVKVRTGIDLNYVNIVGIYRPPHLNATSFCDTLNNRILSKFSGQQRVCIAGDININLLNTYNTETLELSDLLQARSYLPHITLPTRETEHSSTLIDHIWSNILSNAKAGVIHNAITDHYSTFISFCHMGIKHGKVTINFRDTSEPSLHKMYTKLNERLLDFNVENSNDVNHDVHKFHNIVWKTFEECCPLRSKNITLNRILSPWLTKDIILLCQTKRVLHSKVCNNSISQATFRTFNKTLKRVIKLSKLNYFNAKFKDLQSDIKNTWKNINKLVGKSPRSRSVEFEIDGIAVNEPKIIANAFNDHFSEVAPKLLSKIPNFNKSPIDYMGSPKQVSFAPHGATEMEVAKAIMKLPNKKCGTDAIPTHVWKHCCDLVAMIVSKLFNKSLDTGTFPSVLKIAQVIPIHKSGAKTNICNYRPVSLLPTLSKLFEKLMNIRFSHYIESNKILNEHQFGFRKGLNTSDAVVEFLDHAYSSLDAKKYMIAIFLDLSKAFDTLDHEILLMKLQHIGVDTNILQWFQSYLTNRSQLVCFNSIKSNVSKINTGVPQGSILGPILFLIYINDFGNACTSLKYIQFADDTTLFSSCENIGVLTESVNRNLQPIFEWLCVNKLSLNIAKTKYMVISNRPSTNIALKIRDHFIERVAEIKFLGVTLDDKLTFKKHVQNTSNKIASSVGIMYRLKPLVQARTLTSIYFALVQSHLTYAILAWGKTAYTNLRRIRSLHKKAVNYVSPTNGLIPETQKKFMSLDDLYHLHSLCKLFNCLKTDHSEHFRSYLRSLIPNHPISTRRANNGSFNIPYHRCQRSQQSFVYHSISYWNVLPDSVKIIDELSKFKKTIRGELQQPDI